MKNLFIMMNFVLLIGCSSAQKDPKLNYNDSQPDGLYNLADYYAKDGRFEESLANLSILRRKFPYSKYAVDAELKTADIQFQREFYPEAEASYKSFYDLHPDHVKTDYVIFRIGESYFKQLPSTVDRDLKLAQSAIYYFNKVIRSFPKSPYVEKATEFKNQSISMLHNKQDYIGNFYFIRGHYKSAYMRYAELLRQKDLSEDLELKSLYRAALSAYKTKLYEEARKIYLVMAKRFPQREETKKAERELTNGPR